MYITGTVCVTDLQRSKLATDLSRSLISNLHDPVWPFYRSASVDDHINLVIQEASVAVDLDERFERVFDQENKTWKIKETSSLTIFVSMVDVITNADPIPPPRFLLSSV